MNIAEASGRSGVPPRTIRFYEQIGLIAPRRAGNGYRDFSEADAARLALIGRARNLGFGVEDCRSLLALQEDAHRASADVKRLARERLASIDAKIRDLKEMRGSLAALLDTCRGDDGADCGILEGLSGG
ncbi:MerR family transcriptional regulator [Paroceanicella profunda]|uniref:MerR family transcriptional regulator n=1 Tax=Paroceanicella profunda TaxID=2579971 RepID=A0A5B8G0W9_9RHOB|nr:MerR family DNA-binding protein [Paroceanicella profunda]QDL92799.1 MerR family transcriptional regulator [Paroceanicella profunda]